jgi:hypothetical protein
VTGAVGLTFPVTAIRGRRPLTLAAQQSWTPAQAEELAAEYRERPEVRRGHRRASTVWGVGLLTEALVRVPPVYLLPISVGVGASTGLAVLTMAGLTIWTIRFRGRAGRPAVAPEA